VIPFGSTHGPADLQVSAQRRNVPKMDYSFKGRSADEIIEDLETNRLQGEIGAGAYEIAAAAIQAAVARENRKLQLRLTIMALSLSSISVVVAVLALVR
jgi:hypothetical protein